MNIDEMLAGRELDALVAEKVMGWNQIHRRDDRLLGLPPEATIMWGESVMPHLLPVLGYSTDITAAWNITTQIPNAFFLGRPFVVGKVWDARFEDRGDGTWQDEIVVQAVAPTAPLAICRAALKLIESMEGRDAHDQPLD